jgi:hypothetical protein
MLMMTSCRDPGILPRQEPDEEWLQARKPRLVHASCLLRRINAGHLEDFVQFAGAAVSYQ